MSTFLRSALPLTVRGWSVFPISPKKKPLVKWTRAASTYPGAVFAWAQRYPDALVGIATGPSGLLVVDLDLDPGKGLDGPALWREILDGRELSTYTVGTRRGGQHLYFTGDGKTGANVLGPGIDTRGRGGYVVAWPTVLADVPVAPLPDWLAGRLTAGRREDVHTPEALAAHVVPEGLRRPLSLHDLRAYAAQHPTSPSGLDAARVAAGRPWGESGGRDAALHRLAYALVSMYDWLDPEGTADLFVRSCEAVERADGKTTGTAWVAQKLRSKILRVASDRATVASSQAIYDETLIQLRSNT